MTQVKTKIYLSEIRLLDSNYIFNKKLSASERDFYIIPNRIMV